MKKILALIFSFFLSFSLWACPYCAGSSDGKDKNTWMILAGFILLTYVPFYLLFRVAFKKRKKTKVQDVL